MRTAELRELARQYSIETSYTDAAGRKREASRDALAAVIEKRRSQAPERAAIEPVIVLWGNDRTIDVELPEDARVEWDVALEDGAWRSGRSDAFGGTITLDRPLPAGYHTLHVNGAEALIIASPLRAAAPPQRTWGLSAPLYAARTRRSWGTGDLGDLLEWSSWVEHHGGGVVATLPMLASFDDEPSPYSPISRLYWNELYLDVARLPELAGTDLDAGAIAHLQQAPMIDYSAVRREKRRVLELCAARFAGDEDFDRFAAQAGDYARFQAEAEHRPSAHYHLYVQYRMAQQMRAVANAARRMGTGLYLDFPLGVSGSGYDAHRYAPLFAGGMSAGAPPDLFFTKGQNWGFPPFDPDALRVDRYEYFRAAVRHHVSHAGILRIDHVMGLHRLYWIPEGADAADGVYVRYRADELYAVVVLESRRHGCVVVGEDLGTVPPEVPRKMSRHGLRRMYVVQYEVKPGAQPMNEPPAASVASVNTHDMPTFAAFWGAKDVDDRLELGLLDETAARHERSTRAAVRRDVVRHLVEQGRLRGGPTENARTVIEALLAQLAASEAEIVLVNPEDLWGELQPQNVPGVPERSWRHKFRMSLEDARADGSIRRVLDNVDALRARRLLPEQEDATLRGPETKVKEG